MVAGIGGSALVWQVGLLDPQAWCKTFLLLNSARGGPQRGLAKAYIAQRLFSK
jgi:hypothetical protein